MILQINARQLLELRQIEPNLILLDVRQSYEHQEFALENDVLIPLNELEARIHELDAFRDQTIVVYCKAGIRSQVACNLLEKDGFTRLYNLSDGILGWKYLFN